MQRSDTKSRLALRDEILADAQRQAERLTRKAEREAQAMLDKATAESEEARRSALAAAQERAARSRGLMLATLPVDIGRMRSARLEEELLKLRERVRQALRGRSGFAYEQALVNLATEALAHMEGDDFVLELSAEDLPTRAETLRAVLNRVGRPGVAVTIGTEPAAIAGGVIVRDRAGRQVWDNSLEARLDRLWPSLRNQLAAGLGLETDAADSGGQS